jgi:deoxyribodipyrimidine photo-lyase
MSKLAYVVVWFKRDLRLLDHAPLKAAITAGLPVLPLYLWEPTIMADPHYSSRHFAFIDQSLADIKQRIPDHSLQVFEADAMDFFSHLIAFNPPKAVFSYAETGLSITYERDKNLAKLFEQSSIIWNEFQQNGVRRGRKNRQNWQQDWYAFMESPLDQPDWKRWISFSLPGSFLPECKKTAGGYGFTIDAVLQPGGESTAHKYLKTFLSERVANYNAHISKPELSRRSCSRLSPYIAWGNLSIRQVYQQARQQKQTRNIVNFCSRLRWHCHFIQKFEMEDRIEFENVNRGYDSIRVEWDEERYMAWERGKTGFPLVDAAMRCVIQTGYLNFRMRAMLVSFLTHHLWLHWKRGAVHLARCFLDFEPGIHYPQFQMQAGVTGINMVRIYNPVKQSMDHDNEAVFIHKWVPELKVIPPALVHKPWEISPLEQAMFGFHFGRDYPEPIVNLELSAQHAREILFSMQKQASVKTENKRILKTHTLPNRMP